MPNRLLPRTQNDHLLPRRPMDLPSVETNTTNPAAAFGTLVSSGSSANTKNTTYTQLIASTSFNAYWIEIMFSDVTSATTNTSMLVDIAVGAAASEAVIIPNLNAGAAAAQTDTALLGGQRYVFPLFIPSGSRLSATAQGAVTNDDVRCSVWLYGGPTVPDWYGTSVTAYGANTSTSKGVSVVCGTSAAEGSWTQVVASTTADHRYFTAGVGPDADTVVQNGMYFFDLATGASLSEVAFVTNAFVVMTTTEDVRQAQPVQRYLRIPSGTRLAARASSTGAAQNLDVIIYGVN